MSALHDWVYNALIFNHQVWLVFRCARLGAYHNSVILRKLINAQQQKEAAECEDIDTVVLRIDSGGGGVVESDTIYDAVRQVKDSGKIVVASFGNAAASGGYLAACDAGECVLI